jgi:hypothetical protein
MARKGYDKFELATLLHRGDRLFANRWTVQSIATAEPSTLSRSTSAFGLATARKIVSEAQAVVNVVRLFESAIQAGEELVGGKTVLWAELEELVQRGQRTQSKGWQRDPMLNLLANLGFDLDLTPAPPIWDAPPSEPVQRSARVQRIYESSLLSG